MTTVPAVGSFKAFAKAIGAGRLRSLMKRALRALVIPAAVVAIGMGAWYGATHFLLSPSRRFLLPPPQQVWSRSFSDPAHLRPMLDALAVTVKVASLGLLIATAVGVALGAVMSQARWLEGALYPYAVLLQVVPILAIVPLIGLWVGYSTSARVLVCVLISLFPVITNTNFGFRSVDRGLHELFDLGRASWLQRLVRLELPAALPSILTGLRIASGQAVIGAIIGDMFFARGDPGIGTLINNYVAQLRSEDLIAAVLLAAGFGVAVFAFFAVLSSVLVGRWHNSGARR